VEQLNDTLSAILGNQEAMSQIMALARSLEGEAAPERPEQQETEPPREVGSNVEGIDDIGALFGQVDPNVIRLGMRVLQEFRKEDDRKAALLAALRPFVREERQEKLDRAIQIAKLSRGFRVLLDGMRGEELPHV